MSTFGKLYFLAGGALFLTLYLIAPIPPLVISAALILWAILGIAFVVLRLPRSPSPLHHPHPADGLIEIVPIPGALSTPNTADPRFGRLIGLEPAPNLSRNPGPGLLGRLHLIALFHSRGPRDWSDSETARALDAIFRVALWIERQAQLYQAPVNVQLTSSYLHLFDPSSPEPRPLHFAPEPAQGGLSPWEENEDVELVASASRAARSLNLPEIGDLPSLIHSLGARLDTDRLAWLLLLRSSGRSFASLEHDLGLPGVNLAVIHAAESDLPGPLVGPPSVDPSTIAHELLHLFGASDKYGRSLKSFPRGSITSRDVMLLHESRLSRLQIDPLTASELLWPSREP